MELNGGNVCFAASAAAAGRAAESDVTDYGAYKVGPTLCLLRWLHAKRNLLA